MTNEFLLRVILTSVLVPVLGIAFLWALARTYQRFRWSDMDDGDDGDDGDASDDE